MKTLHSQTILTMADNLKHLKHLKHLTRYKLFALWLFAALLALGGCGKGGDGGGPGDQCTENCGPGGEPDVNVLDKITDPVFKAYAQKCMAADYVGVDADGNEVPYDKWDTDGNGELSTDEAEAVRSIRMYGDGPTDKMGSTSGLEYFTGLLALEIVSHELTSLDLRGCTELGYLYCDDNKLATLLLPSGTALKWLYCGGNLLTGLDAVGCTGLEELWCGNNRLATLTFPSGTALKGLYCFNNQLTGLDASGCKGLFQLDCYRNQLATLTLPSGNALEIVTCYGNPLASLDASGCTGLGLIDCGNGVSAPLSVTVPLGSDLDEMAVWAFDGNDDFGTITSYGTPINGVTVGVKGGSFVGGVMWAETNVDAPNTFAATSESHGLLYQWGRKVGWSLTGDPVSTPSGSTWSSTGSTDANWTDANSPCPDGWRLPTWDEMVILLTPAKVGRQWKSASPTGMTLTDQTTGASIFLPAAGVRTDDGRTTHFGDDSYYWTSEKMTGNGVAGDFYASNAQLVANNPANGMSVRCVMK